MYFDKVKQMSAPQRTRPIFITSAALAGLLGLTGCGLIPPGESMTPTLTTNAGRSANVILEDFISTLGDAFDNSGVTWSAWDRSNRNYSTRTCYLGDSKGNQYTVHDSTGGKVADPQIAINAIKTYWETQNYTIGNVVNWPGGSIELTATSPSGIQVIFGASTNGSSLTVTSDCTLDPALEPSLDGTSIPAPSASS